MSKRFTRHSTFTIERSFAVPTAAQAEAWPAIKAGRHTLIAAPTGSGKTLAAFLAAITNRQSLAVRDLARDEGKEIDFRVGGRETVSGGPPGGPIHSYNALYQDIVPNERIVLTYEMHLDKTRISVTLGTSEFKPAGLGTKLVYTEQSVFLDGHDDAGAREHGTRALFDNLDAALKREAVN